MRTIISNDKGLDIQADGDGFVVAGRDFRNAVFEDRWDDLIAFIDQGTGPAALTYEGYRDTGYFMRFFRRNQDDNIFMTYQMPHTWDNTTSIRPHMHLIPMASGSGDVKMDYVYSWSIVGSGTLPAAAGWISGSVTASYTPADQYVQRVMSFGTIVPPANAGDSSILVFKVERPGSSDAADTYQTNKTGGTTSANVGVLFFDLHYQKIKAGSVTEHPEG